MRVHGPLLWQKGKLDLHIGCSSNFCNSHSFATWYGIPTVCLLGLESGFLGCSPVTPELLPWIKDSAVFVCCLSILADLISDLHLLCMQVDSCWRSTISTCCSCSHSCGYHDSSSGKIETMNNSVKVWMKSFEQVFKEIQFATLPPVDKHSSINDQVFDWSVAENMVIDAM